MREKMKDGFLNAMENWRVCDLGFVFWCGREYIVSSESASFFSQYLELQYICIVTL